MSPLSTTRSSSIFARSREVTRHHLDAEKPGKPLYLLVPGGLLAGAALLGIGLTGYAIWYTHSMPETEGLDRMALLLFPYFGGLLVFSYGYELYDWPRAIWLTLILGAIGLALVVVFVALAAVLGALGGESDDEKADHEKDKGSGSGTSRSSSSSHARDWGSFPDLGSDSNSPKDAPTQLAHCPTCGRPLLLGIGSSCRFCSSGMQSSG